MKKFKAYYLLFFISILLFLIGFITKQETIDINIHDTYYVIMRNHFSWLLSILLFIVSLVYLLFDNLKIKLINLLSVLHIFGTIVLLLSVFIDFGFFDINELPERYFTITSFENNRMLFKIFMLLLFQILFIINIFVILIKKMRLLRAS